MKPNCKNCKTEKREKKSMLCLECDRKEYPMRGDKLDLRENRKTAYSEALELGREYRKAELNGWV